MTGTPVRRERKAHEDRIFGAPDALESLLDEVAEGNGMSGWCGRMGVRYRSCVAWIMSDVERSRLVDEATKARARLAAEAGEALGRKLAAPDVRTGVEWVDDGPPTIEAKSARVALDAFKFAATTGDRERFSRTVTHQHTHKMQADHLQALRRAGERGRPAHDPSTPAGRGAAARAGDQPIDAEYHALPPPAPDLLHDVPSAQQRPAFSVACAMLPARPRGPCPS